MDEETYMAIYERTKINSEYLDCEKRLRDLGRRMMGILGENRILFLEYEKIIYLAECLSLEAAYDVGVSVKNAYAQQNA